MRTLVVHERGIFLHVCTMGSSKGSWWHYICCFLYFFFNVFTVVDLATTLLTEKEKGMADV